MGAASSSTPLPTPEERRIAAEKAQAKKDEKARQKAEKALAKGVKKAEKAMEDSTEPTRQSVWERFTGTTDKPPRIKSVSTFSTDQSMLNRVERSIERQGSTSESIKEQAKHALGVGHSHTYTSTHNNSL